MTEEPQDPKIVVDDDWKTQVEQEKETLRDHQDESAEDAGELQMPPASIPVMITTLATQALANLGQIPDPIENQPVIRKPLAKHFIDSLAVLEEKTAGNLTPDESALLTETLHQLRMVFVAIPDSMPPAGDDATGPASPTIEMP